MRLQTVVPNVFYGYTLLRAATHSVLSLALQFSPFAKQFPVFTVEHFLVYGSYEGEEWLVGRARFLSLWYQTKIPSGLAHFSLKRFTCGFTSTKY